MEESLRGKVLIHLILFAEVLEAVASILLILSAGFYLRHLEKIKRQRKLRSLELIMYITIQLAFVLFVISLLIRVFFR